MSSAFDPLRVPDEVWAREDVGRALDGRDFGELFRLLSKHLGASQTRIGTATGLSQGTVCVIMNDKRGQHDVLLHRHPQDVIEVLDYLNNELRVDNMQISPAYAYGKAPDQEHWLGVQQTHDPRCANCMAHCGYEPTAVIATMGSLKESVRAAIGG